MQKLAEICIRRPVFATMIVLSLVVVGAASYFRLGVDRFPSVDLPTVSVRTKPTGRILRRKLNRWSRSKSRKSLTPLTASMSCARSPVRARSVIIATFKLDRNLESAAQDVRDRVNSLGRDLPDDATPPVVQKFDNDSTPVVTISLSG